MSLGSGSRTSLLGEALGDVRQRWQEAKAEVASLRVELAEADAEKKSLKAALKRETERASQVSDELKNFKDGDETTAEQAKRSAAELENFRQRLSQKDQEITALKREKSSSSESTRSELQNLKETLAEEREALEEARAELAMLRVSAQASESARSTELRSTKDSISELSSRNSELEDELEDLEKKLASLTSENKRLRGDVETAKDSASSYTELKRSYSNVQRKLEDLEDEKEQREKELTESLREMKQRAKVLEGERDDAVGHRETAEDALEDVQDRADELQGKLDRLGTRASHLEAELTETNRQFAKAKEELERERARYTEEVTSARRGVEAEKAESRRTRLDTEQRMETLKTRANNLMRERDETRNALHDAQGRAEAAEKALADQKYQLEKLRANLSDSEAEVLKLRDEVEEGEANQAELEETLRARENELSTTKRRMEAMRKESQDYKSNSENSIGKLAEAEAERDAKDAELISQQKKFAVDMRIANAREAELKDEVETVRGEAERTAALLARCRKDLDESRKNAAEVRAANTQLQLDMSSATENRESALGELSALQTALQASREKVYALEAEKDKLSSELHTELSGHEHALSVHMSRFDDAEKRVEAIRKQKAALERSHAEELESKDRVHRESIEALKRSLEDHAKAKAEAVKRADDLSRQLSDAIMGREDQETSLTKVQKDNIALQETCDRQSVELQKHQATILELRTLVDGTSDAKAREVAMLRNQMEEARKHAEDMQARMEQVRAQRVGDMETLNRERSEAQMRLESIESEHKSRFLEADEIKRQLLESEKQRRALEERDTASADQMDYMKVQLNSANERCEMLAAKLKEMESSVVSTRREADGEFEKSEERVSELRRDLSLQRSQLLQMQEAIKERDRLIEMATRERDAMSKRAEEFEHLRHEEMLRSAKKRSALEIEVDARERAAAHLATLLRKERRKSETAMALALINTSPESDNLDARNLGVGASAPGEGAASSANGASPGVDKRNSRKSARVAEKWGTLAKAALRMKNRRTVAQRPWWQKAMGAWVLRSVMVTPVALVAQLVSDSVQRQRREQQEKAAQQAAAAAKRRTKASSMPRSVARTVNTGSATSSAPPSAMSTPSRAGTTPAPSPARTATSSAPASQPGSRASSAPSSPARSQPDGKPPVPTKVKSAPMSDLPPPPERNKKPPMDYRG